MVELKMLGFEPNSVIFSDSASFTHNLVSGMQSLNVGVSQDAMFLQIFSEQRVFWTLMLGAGSFDIESSEFPGPIVSKL